MGQIDRAREVFDAVKGLAPGEREVKILEACRGDEDLAAEVRGIMAEYDAAGATGAHEAGFPNQKPRARRPGQTLLAGSMVGPYRIVRELGEGGFGTVYLADQTAPVRRNVALKVIKPGMHSPAVLARFESERQSLAVMNHDHVAKVFDAGTTGEGLPYFVMEFVEGEPITDFCDAANNRKGLSVEERLRLFIPVCEAVQHAHSKGIIHRDLKPSNILVSQVGGKPSPKVIDFGIAKALDQGSLGEATFTDRGMIIGSPEYMSPEQAGAGDVDTRSDVYSLGVVLYELLTGLTPFDSKDLRSRGWTEMLRIIREQEPPSPSARLAAAKENPKRALAPLLKKELELIPRMAMRKERLRRYESPSALAADVENYLNHRALIAAPESTVYRVGKFVRRHRIPVSAGVTVILALTGGVAVSLAALSAEAEQKRSALREKDNAERIAAFMSDTLEGAGPSLARGRDATMLREMMDRAAARIKAGELAAAPASELRLRMTIGDTYRQIGEHARAEEMLEPAVPIARQLQAGDSPALADAINELALLELDHGEYSKAEAGFREYLAMCLRVHRADDRSTAAAMQNLASALNAQAKTVEAEEELRNAIAMWRRLTSGDDPDLAGAISTLGDVLRNRGDFEAAEVSLREALKMRRRLFGGIHPDLVKSLMSLGCVLHDRGAMAEAESLFREALGVCERVYPRGHRDLFAIKSNLALTLTELGRQDEAETFQAEAVAGLRQVFPGGNRDLSTGLTNLGWIYQQRGDFENAEPLLREAVAIDRRMATGDDPGLVKDLSNLAQLLRDKGDSDGAESYQRQALEMARRCCADNRPFLASLTLNMALCRQDKDDYEGAAAYWRESLELRRRLYGESDGRTASVKGALGTCLSELAWRSGTDQTAFTSAASMAAEGETLLRECVGIGEQRASEDWRSANTRSALGGAMVVSVWCDKSAAREERLERLRQAEMLLKQSEEVFAAHLQEIPSRARPDRMLEAARDRASRLHKVRSESDP